MLTVKEAIEKRRSIRKFLADDIPGHILLELIRAAQLAPSGCNAQPWRFKIVKEAKIKQQLANAAYNQMFIENAPAVIVCCADIKGYLNGSVSGLQDLKETGEVKEEVVEIINSRVKSLRGVPIDEIGPRIAVNVAIAIEHIVLRALDFNLGTCWIRLLNEQKIKEIFGWDDNIYVVALLPVGYPAESPKPRKRLTLNDILL